MYQRDKLLQSLLRWRDQDVIKVVTGIRRSGKSVLMEMARKAILASGVPKDCVASIDFERREFLDLDSPDKVFAELDRQLKGRGKKYVFLDEVQRLPKFEVLVDALYTDKRYDCYITGSNAWLLSGELATYLAGRYVEIHVTPFSFAEFADGMKGDRERLWRDYERYGSFPLVRQQLERGAADVVDEYLEGVYNTVLVRDVASRVKMSDVGTVRKIAAFLFDNVSNLTNVKRICDSLSASGGKGSYQSAAAYVDLLCDAFLFYRCDRVDVRGLEILKSGAKYYAVDPGLRYHVNGNRAGDSGRVLENVVYLELKRRHRHVFVGALRNGGEIDFVTRDGDEVAYYQVAETVKDPETLARELRPLKDLSDNYPKYLIVGDYGNPVMHDGIRQLSAHDFLLENS